jgi:hypothetical protein
MKLSIQIFFLFIIGFSLLLGFQNSKTGKGKKVEIKIEKLNINQVHKKYTDSLMKINGVTGVGIGKDKNKDCLVVFVKSLTSDIKKKIPKNLEGFKVKLEETGEIRAFPKKKN